MKIPIEIDNKIEEVTLREIGARLWPFGKWKVVWVHVTKGRKLLEKTTTKINAINSFQLNKNNLALRAAGIKKEGGLFHGIEFRPRTKKEKLTR